MAKNTPAKTPTNSKTAKAPKKPGTFKMIGEAYRFTKAGDPKLPWLIAISVIVTIGAFVGFALWKGGLALIIYMSIFGIVSSSLAAMITLTRRAGKVAFARMDSSAGGSLAAAQSIRRGWLFGDDPDQMDPRGMAFVFRGVGKGGIALVGEGGPAARKLIETSRRRLAKVVPNVPIHDFYMGKAHGDLSARELVRAIKKVKKSLTRREREAVTARLRALGGVRVPVPKGIDPMRARPNRKQR